MRRFLTMGLSVFAMLGVGFGVLMAREVEQPGGTQTAYQRQQMFLVTFIVTGAESSADQITIIFDETSLVSAAPSESAPDPVFGEEIVQEFSFSARDVVDGEILFDRFVRDLSFVEAPIIRIVNHGATPWLGESISVEIDGQPFFTDIPIEAKLCATGEDSTEGLKGFNREDWAECVFWEAELAELRQTPQ